MFSVAGAFEDSDVTHVEGEVDPIRDFEIISEELRLKDEEMLSKLLEKLEKTCIRANDKKLKPEYVSTYTHYIIPFTKIVCMTFLFDLISEKKNIIENPTYFKRLISLTHLLKSLAFIN